MPEFYAAIFGTGEEDAVGPPSAAAKGGGAGVVGATGSNVGVASGVGVSSDGGVGGVQVSAGRAEGAEAATMGATLQQQQFVASGADVRSEGAKGVALQERLVRLRETFAKEQCAAVLRQASGW